MDNIVLTDEINELLEDMEHGSENLFISGRAGTGKSTLLKTFVQMTNKSVAVVAPTGIAAINAHGQTIHSFFKFPPRLLLPSSIRGRNTKLMKNLDILIIDEISMVRVDLMDAIDIALRKSRKSYKPFGGVKVLMFGDLYQLPPVTGDPTVKQYLREKYNSPYFFSADVWFEAKMPHLRLLNHVFRQTDKEFISLLNAVRDQSMDESDLKRLNSRYIPEFDTEKFYITLTTTNALANAINTKSLRKLDNPVFSYQAETKGDFNHRLFPTKEILHLKENAQVMCIKNDSEGRYVNGTIGIVKELSEDKIMVEIERGGSKDVIEIEKTEWEKIQYTVEDKDGVAKIKSKVTGKFTQYPLRLAWATTIHKSQGKTYEKCIINLGRGAFAHGQTYVALSRCTTLEGIILKSKIEPRDVILDVRIVDFYRDAGRWS